MSDVIERLRAANPVLECDPPPRSVLASALDAETRPLRPDRSRSMPSFVSIAALAAALLAVAIFVGAVTMLSRSPRSQSAASVTRPAGERSLSSVVGTLALPATAADRRVVPAVRALLTRVLPADVSGRPDYSTVRIAGSGPDHSRLVFVALQPVPNRAFARLPAKARRFEEELLGHWRVALLQVGGRYPGAILTGVTAAQVEEGSAWESGLASKTTWSMVIVVPDGVMRVVARGAGGPAITLSVHNNVAGAWNLHGKLRWPRTMVWSGARGKVLARIGPTRSPAAGYKPAG